MAGSTPDPPLKAFFCVFLFSGTGCSSAGIVYLTGEHFGIITNHEKEFKDNMGKMQRWREALSKAASVSGSHYEGGYVSNG